MYTTYLKRVLDILLAIIILIVLALPLIIIIAITMICSSGSPFFVQERSGKNRKTFKMYKFRSMPANIPAHIPSNSLTEIDLSLWQRWIRKTSIDELPQLVNILKGDMSFVGPRPVICEESDLLDERDKYHANDVLPGLTGWAQVNGRDILDYQTKAKLDGYYVKNINFWFDLKCIWLTIFCVLKQEDINH